jgi:hypothetical protein
MAKKTQKRRKGGMPLPNDAALSLMPESSDTIVGLSGGKRRRRNGRTHKRKH